MPDDPEIQDELLETSPEATETETPESDTAVEETESKGPEHIPYQRFQEVWNERQDARAYAQQLQMQILQMQQQVNAIQNAANAPREPEIDPDVEQIVAPVLNKYVKPLMNQLNAAKAELGQVQAKAEAEAAWNYVLQNVPDMDDLKADLAREIESKSPVIQKKITSDPDLIIEMAEKVRLKRATGGMTRTSAAQQDLKARSRSESGGVRNSPSSKTIIDWASLSDEEFAKAEAAMLRRR